MTRLIDGDALLTELVKMNDFGYLTAKKAIRRVKQSPTIDAEPVRHGKWKKSGNWGRVYKCDQCGNYLDFDGVNAGRGSANYCPNCGCRMVEDER